jgi:hypothetical protein
LLVLFAVGVVWFVIMLAVLAACGLLTALVAGVPAYLLYHATQSLLLPLVWAVPVGALTFVVPIVLATGLYQVFRASVWNQVYRQLAGLPAWQRPRRRSQTRSRRCSATRAPAWLLTDGRRGPPRRLGHRRPPPEPVGPGGGSGSATRLAQNSCGI